MLITNRRICVILGVEPEGWYVEEPYPSHDEVRQAFNGELDHLTYTYRVTPDDGQGLQTLSIFEVTEVGHEVLMGTTRDPDQLVIVTWNIHGMIPVTFWFGPPTLLSSKPAQSNGSSPLDILERPR